MQTIMKRLRTFGYILVAAGLFVAGFGAFYGVKTASDGLASAQAMYEAQGVTLTYNENGQLIDRGTPEAAAKIMDLLTKEWQYPVNAADFDPSDPIVDTRSELMFYYATITYHVLHGEVAVKLTEEQVPITYRGVTYSEAGEYRVAPDAYYAQLDRTHPIEGQLRAAWTPAALALTGALSSGHANQAAGELALATTLAVTGIGGLFAFAGAGLVWVSYGIPSIAPSPRVSTMVSRVR